MKILITVLISLSVFAGGEGPIDLDWDNSRIVDMMNDFEVRQLDLHSGEFVFDHKHDAFIVQTDARKVLVKTNQEAKKFKVIKEHLEEEMMFETSLENVLKEVDLRPYEKVDFR
jgi:hypothetical protein